jgi:hypothetical protein
MGEANKKALWLRNIAAYWRARAAGSQNPDAQLRLNATAAHYEELARGVRSTDTRSRYVFSYASKQRVLLVSAGAVVTEETYLQGYDTIVRFISSRGPCSMILDLSAVEDFKLSFKFASTVARRKPAVPIGMSRFIVAPQPEVYSIWHSVELMRSSTRVPITVLRNLDEALARLGVSRSEFSELGDLWLGVSSR